MNFFIRYVPIMNLAILSYLNGNFLLIMINWKSFIDNEVKLAKFVICIIIPMSRVRRTNTPLSSDTVFFSRFITINL